ncbi:MAG: class I SAM-dependent methyltransferase [Thermoanaerobaculia bacterium]
MAAEGVGGIRTGDTIDIEGAYQHRALTEGFVVQRFWHRLKTVTIERVAPPEPQMRVLDLGCGSGVVSAYLAERSRTVDAVDANLRAIAYARGAFPRENLTFHLARADALPFPEGRFDRVYILEVLEHLYWEQLRTLAAEVHRLLAPAGTVFLTAPNYHSPWPVLEATVDLLRFAPHMEGEQHVSRPTPRRLRELADASGFDTLVQGRFAGLAPFSSIVSWRLAETIDRAETRIGCPLGSLLYALWRKR